MKWLKGAPVMSGMNMYYVYYLLSIRFFPRKTGPLCHNSNCLRGDVKGYTGKCTKYFIDMHYQPGRLFQMYKWWIHLAPFRKFFYGFQRIFKHPFFCGLSICIWFCSGFVQSAILIATTKEGNVLLSKYFLNHIDTFVYIIMDTQLTGNKQHNPPLYLPGLGSRLPHKLTQGFSSSSTPTCPLFEPLFHIFTNNLRKVPFRILKPSAPWALSNWTQKIIEISSVFWGTARLSRRKGLGELVHSPRHRSELLETSIFKK